MGDLRVERGVVVRWVHGVTVAREHLSGEGTGALARNPAAHRYQRTSQPGSVDTEGPDSLTELPRLRRFQQFLDGAIGRTRHGLARGGALVAIDLDKFGPINKDPHLGFAVGNEVLAEIGRRLRSQARTGDAVARPGGDEFGGFFAGSFDRVSATRLGERLLAEIKRPVVTSAGIVEVGGSIGIVIIEPQPGLPDNRSLMELADATMQAVKRSGGGVRVYDPYSASGSGPAELRLD